MSKDITDSKQRLKDFFLAADKFRLFKIFKDVAREHQKGDRYIYLEIIENGNLNQDASVLASEILECVDEKKLFQWLGSFNFSIRLNNIQRVDQQINEICQNHFKENGTALSCNGYFSPAGVDGLDIHSDDQDLDLLQILGEKDWFIYLSADGSELKCFSSLSIRKKLDPKIYKKVSLREGEILELEAGVLHSAKSNASDSFHINFAENVHLNKHTAYQLIYRQLLKEELDLISIDHFKGNESLEEIKKHLSSNLKNTLDSTTLQEVEDSFEKYTLEILKWGRNKRF